MNINKLRNKAINVTVSVIEKARPKTPREQLDHALRNYDLNSSQVDDVERLIEEALAHNAREKANA